MKKKNVISVSVFSLAIIVMAAGFTFNAYAQNPDTGTNINFRADHFGFNANLSDAQKADLEARRAEMDALRAKRQATMQTAINSGNYETWVQAVKDQMGDNAPILSQVNADNFAQFVEAHQLMTQAQEKFAAIGIDHGFGMHEGFGMRDDSDRGERMGRGMGHGLGLERMTNVDMQ